MMGMSNQHNAQEVDGFCFSEMNVFWSKICKSTPAINIVKMLAEDGKTVFLSTVIRIEMCPVPKGKHMLPASSIKVTSLNQVNIDNLDN